MQHYVIMGLRWLLGAIFLYAGITKALDVAVFATAIGRYAMLPELGNMLLASTLPYLEISTALLLFSGRWLRPAALLSVLMYSMFCVALLTAALRGLSIDCGCFGSAAGAWSSVGVALLRSVSLLGLSGYLFFVLAAPMKTEERK